MRRNSVINDPQFIIGLGLLLLNDLWLKWQFHNWLTGKLSDLLGLYICPVFLSYFYPRHRSQAYWFTALLFIFWKSNWANGLIELMHTWHLPFDRVADPTDLIALIALPLSYKYCCGRYVWRLPASNAIAVCALLVFCSDSIPMRRLTMPEAKFGSEVSLLRGQRLTERDVRAKLDKAGLTYYDDSVTWGDFCYDTMATSPAPVRQARKHVVHFLRIRGFRYGNDTIHNINCQVQQDTSGAWLKVWSFDVGPLGKGSFRKQRKKYDAIIREHLLPQ